jgi:hypothetical protein
VSVIREIQIIIDNEPPTKGEFSIEVEQIDVSTALGRHEPDRSWTFIDAAGHFHAWADADSLPTLETKNEWVSYDEPDEDGEDGYMVSTSHCRICGEQIQPGYRYVAGDSGFRKFAAGRTFWTVKVNGEGALRDRKSVRIIRGEQMHFGIGEIVEVFDDHGRPALVISGAGELGQRKAPARVGG